MTSAHRHPGLNTIKVTDLDSAELDGLLRPYRDQKDAWLRVQRSGGTGIADDDDSDGLFMAEGELVVGTLIESEHLVVSVLCTPRRLETMRAELERLPADTPVLVADRRVVERIVGFDLHRGVLAVGRRRHAPAATELMESSGLLVLCEELANHDNIGAVFRNVACLAGVERGTGACVLLSAACCDPLYRKSLRVSMGHALRVPFARLDPWAPGIAKAKAAGFETIALTPDPAAEDIRHFKHTPNTRLALMLGAEGPGLAGPTLEAASRRVRIPMAPGADSLNVATSLAVALSHLCRD